VPGIHSNINRRDTMKPIIIPASIEAVATRRDRTLKITIGTNELPPDVAASILSLQNEFAFFAIKKEDFGKSELETIEAHKSEIDESKKTASQRLRGVLFRIWERTANAETFETYYIREMERIITHFKTKIE